MISLSDEQRAYIIESIFRFLDDLLDIDNISFKQTINRIHPIKLQLIKQILLMYRWTCFREKRYQMVLSLLKTRQK